MIDSNWCFENPDEAAKEIQRLTELCKEAGEIRYKDGYEKGYEAGKGCGYEDGYDWGFIDGHYAGCPRINHKEDE